MPRQYEPWDMDDETRNALRDRMSSGMFAGIPEPGSADNVQALQNRFGRERLTEWLSGTADKKSRAWKSARDSLGRWRRGSRGISGKSRDRLRSAGQKGRLGGVLSRGSLHVSLTATVRTSRTTWTGVMSADLTGGALRDYVSALESGEYERAAMIVADEYGLDPEYIEGIESVHGFDADGLDDLESDDEED